MTSPAHSPAPAPRRRRSPQDRAQAWLGWGLAAPSLLVFAVFFLYPIGHAAVLSFTDWDLSGPMRFVGLQQYRALWSDEGFRAALWNSARYSVASVALTLLGGLGLAALLDRPGRFARWVQASVFTSYIVSWVGVSLLWLWILDEEYGLLNQALQALGGPKVGWLSDPDVALWSLVGVTVWKLVGYNMVLYLAAMQAIPRDLYEAAALDGAGPWRRFWSITLPQLAPTTLFVLVTSLIMTFQGFDVVRIMTQGGPVHATSISVHYIYEEAFIYVHLGKASAAIMVFFGLILALTLGQFALFRRGREGAS